MLGKVISQLCKKTKIDKTGLEFKEDKTFASASTEKKEITIDRYKTEEIEGITVKSKNCFYLDLDITEYLTAPKEYNFSIKIASGDASKFQQHILGLNLRGSLYKKIKENIRKLSISENPYDSELMVALDKKEDRQAATLVCKLLEFKDSDFEKPKKDTDRVYF